MSWGRTNLLLADACARLGVRCEPISTRDTDFFARLSVDGRAALVSKTRSPFLTQVAQTLVNNKFVSREVMAAVGVPVVTGLLVDEDAPEAVEAALGMLDSGEGRVAEPDGKGGWTVNQWLKKAVMLSFRLNDNRVMDGGSAGHPAFDKVPSKFAGWDDARFREAGFRVVPGAIAREGAYIAPGCVLMPSFVNIGAYVGKGTMVDTWASIGSCAQIGENCHHRSHWQYRHR